ncbi:MAG: ion channel [Flavobacteriales bacterium]
MANVVLGIFESEKITFNMVLGVFCGYLLLGLIATFSNMLLLSYMPEAVDGLTYLGDFVFVSTQRQYDVFVNIMYYSFVTMTSIGYGDLLPLVSESKMLSILIGISGQFYMVVIVALIIGKYLNKE